MNKLELSIIHELSERQISRKNLNKLIENIYCKALTEKLQAKDAVTEYLKEENNSARANRKRKYEAVYLPFNERGANSPETLASNFKVFYAPDDWTALVYSIALTSAERETYFKDEKFISKKEARYYVSDFLYPEAVNSKNVSFEDLYNLLRDTQNDDGKGTWEPYTDYGYLFSLTDDNGDILYKGDLDPHDWNYESFFWWHDGELSDKYSAYLGTDEETIEDHLPKRRF